MAYQSPSFLFPPLILFLVHTKSFTINHLLEKWRFRISNSIISRSSSSSIEPPFKIVDAGPDCIFNVSMMIAGAKLQQRILTSLEPTLSSNLIETFYLEDLNRLQVGFSQSERSLNRMYVATDMTNSTIGYVDICRNDSNIEKYPSAYVSDVVVTPGWRRKGVARALLARCEELCAIEWSESTLHLWVETHNIAGINLYRQIGYLPIRGETGDTDEPASLKVESIIPGRRYYDATDTTSWDDLVVRFDRLLLQKIVPLKGRVWTKRGTSRTL